MRKIPAWRAALLTLSLSVPALAHATSVNVDIHIGQPGYYGRIDIGDFGRPKLIYREPIVIYPVSIRREPIYLHVPPGHAKNWRKHCSKYNACGERVYFVQDSWYEREYVPRYQAIHHERRDYHEDRHEENHGNRNFGHHEDKHIKHDKGPGKALGKREGHGNKH